jgi:hypothetical protein
MGNYYIESKDNNHIRILDILQWFSRFTFKEFCDNVNQIFLQNKTNLHIQLNENNVKNFLHKLSSLRKNKHPYPMNVILSLPHLENSTINNDNLYHLHNFLSLGIMFCTRNKKDKSNTNNMKYLMHMLNNTPLFIETFINELIKITILIQWKPHNYEYQTLINNNEYNYRCISNEKIISIIKNKLNVTLSNEKVAEGLFTKINTNSFSNFYLELCYYFIQDTLLNENYFNYHTEILNQINNSLSLQQDDIHNNNTNDPLNYLKQYTFKYFINSLLCFDTQEQNKMTQLVSSDLENLLSQRVTCSKCKIFFEQYFSNTYTNDKNKIEQFKLFGKETYSLFKLFESNHIKCGIHPKLEFTKLTLAIFALLYCQINDVEKIRFICSLLMKSGKIRKKNITNDTLFLTFIYLSNTKLSQYSNLYNKETIDEHAITIYEDRIMNCKNQIIQTIFGDSDELSLQDFLNKLNNIGSNFTPIYFRKELELFNCKIQ